MTIHTHIHRYIYAPRDLESPNRLCRGLDRTAGTMQHAMVILISSSALHVGLYDCSNNNRDWWVLSDCALAASSLRAHELCTFSVSILCS